MAPVSAMNKRVIQKPQSMIDDKKSIFAITISQLFPTFFDNFIIQIISHCLKTHHLSTIQYTHVRYFSSFVPFFLLFRHPVTHKYNSTSLHFCSSSSSPSPSTDSHCFVITSTIPHSFCILHQTVV